MSTAMLTDSPLFRLMQLHPEPPKEADEKYYAAFGKFIAAYAAAETAVHQLARKVSGLKDDKARVLFGGMRIGEVTIRTKGLLKLSRRSPRVRREIESCLKQFDIVGLERDKMVHRHTTYHRGVGTVSNISTAKSIQTHEVHTFDLADLLSMQLDCLVIFLKLSHIFASELGKADTDFAKSVRGPWHYKPAPPKTQPTLKIRRIAEALLNPPRSSRA